MEKWEAWLSSSTFSCPQSSRSKASCHTAQYRKYTTWDRKYTTQYRKYTTWDRKYTAQYRKYTTSVHHLVMMLGNLFQPFP